MLNEKAIKITVLTVLITAVESKITNSENTEGETLASVYSTPMQAEKRSCFPWGGRVSGYVALLANIIQLIKLPRLRKSDMCIVTKN